MQFQPALRQRVAQILLQLAALFGIAMQIGGIEMVPPAPAIFGGVKRQIGVSDQIF